MAVANNLHINDEIVLDGINKTALIADQSNNSVDVMHFITSLSTNISRDGKRMAGEGLCMNCKNY